MGDPGCRSPDPADLHPRSVYRRGSLFRGPQTVIQAIADGRTAADSIHQYLTRGEVKAGQKALQYQQGEETAPGGCR